MYVRFRTQYVYIQQVEVPVGLYCKYSVYLLSSSDHGYLLVSCACAEKLFTSSAHPLLLQCDPYFIVS